MTTSPFLPNSQKVQQTLRNAHIACKQMEIAGLELQEIIDRLENDIREQRLKRLQKSCDRISVSSTPSQKHES